MEACSSTGPSTGFPIAQFPPSVPRVQPPKYVYRRSVCEVGLTSEDSRYAEEHHLRSVGPRPGALMATSSCPELPTLNWGSRMSQTLKSPSKRSLQSTAQSILQGKGRKKTSLLQLASQKSFVRPFGKVYGDSVKQRDVEHMQNIFVSLDPGTGYLELEDFLTGMKNATVQRIMKERFLFQPHASEKIFRLLDDRKVGEISLARWFTCIDMLMSQPPESEGDIEALVRDAARQDRRRLEAQPELRSESRSRAFTSSPTKMGCKMSSGLQPLPSNKWVLHMHPLHMPGPVDVSLVL